MPNDLSIEDREINASENNNSASQFQSNSNFQSELGFMPNNQTGISSSKSNMLQTGPAMPNLKLENDYNNNSNIHQLGYQNQSYGGLLDCSTPNPNSSTYLSPYHHSNLASAQAGYHNLSSSSSINQLQPLQQQQHMNVVAAAAAAAGYPSLTGNPALQPTSNGSYGQQAYGANNSSSSAFNHHGNFSQHPHHHHPYYNSSHSHNNHHNQLADFNNSPNTNDEIIIHAKSEYHHKNDFKSVSLEEFYFFFNFSLICKI